MKVLSLPMGADTGGVTAAIQRAFENVEGWEFRSIISSLNSIDYPRDMEWTHPNVNTFWRWADVIHLHHNTIAPELLTRGWKKWRLPRRAYLLEFHGTGFREDPKTHLRKAKVWKALPVVSTLDLWLLGTDLEWLPCPVTYRQRQRIEDGMIRIAHAPTAREIKSTGAFLDATERLKDEGYPIEVDLIEGVTWKECLARKAKADIYYDQVKLGYGNNAIECWGMGIPVIAGAQPPTLEEMERRFGSLPFYNATEETLYQALHSLIEDEGLRDSYGQRGLEHVQRFHDERVVVEQLKGLYQRALG